MWHKFPVNVESSSPISLIIKVLPKRDEAATVDGCL